MPKPVIARLNAELNKGLNTPDIHARLEKIGVDIAPQTPEEMGSYIDAEIRKWTKVTREAGIRGER